MLNRSEARPVKNKGERRSVETSGTGNHMHVRGEGGEDQKAIERYTTALILDESGIPGRG